MDSSKKISMGTQVMAVRVLRLLWESYSNRQNMIHDGAVRAVSLVLIRYSEKWSNKENTDPVKKQIEKLLENVLKCMLLFSKWGSLECAQQMLADGNGFKALVTLIDINPYSASKCLTNLSHVARSRSDIANAAAVECIVDKIRDHVEKKPNDRCPNDLVSALCLFCRHSMNCSEVKRAGGLQLILQVLKNCKSRRQEYQIVNALFGFQFDEQSQEILVSNGIVNIIIDCLERNLKCKEPLNEKHNLVVRKKRKKHKLKLHVESIQYGKRKRDTSPSEESSSSPGCSQINDQLAMFMSGRMTPPDSDSSPFSSPSCTPPRKNGSDDEQDDMDTELDKEISQLLEVPDPESETEEHDGECDNEKTHFESADLQEKTIIMMLLVLSRVSHMKPDLAQMSLGSKRSLVILLKYLRESKYPSGRITTLLTKIVSNPDNLLLLIESESVLLIHSLTDSVHGVECKKCYRMESTGQLLLKHISNFAQSDCGKEQLLDAMQKADDENKRKCIMSVPFIITLKPLLLKFMDTWSGLNLLIHLCVTNAELRYQTCAALNKLACSIHIDNPVMKYCSKKISTLTDRYEFNPAGKNIVTIQLDDGSTVTTDRDFLIERADYFKVMLTGAFKESNEEVIRLTNVSNHALQCLFNLLKDEYEKKDPQQLNVNLITILEVIVLTDIYLMDGLTDWLTRCVEQYLLKVDTACDIYNWSIMSGTNFLRVETVAFVLTAKMKDCERHELFESIVECGLLDEIKDDVYRLISRYLKIR
ncbi:hypothetical protein CBL_11691 [Carabus blaptoides fortunei]